jgi:asparagine synthase (glutamine-hydrolysing)
MCGIFGYYSFNQTKVDKVRFKESLTTIIHRGPNFQQSLFYNNDRIALGHVRLSIIDLSESANQPMEIGKYHIVYNGEIYNYIEIRNELKKNGYTFNTSSDTEVLVKAYDHWGGECVNRFNGMWAFAILNITDSTLFCSRDRFGVKPFNYYLSEEKFIFSSEIKPIITYDLSLRKPNYNSIALFCREGINGEIPETWFEGIYRLKPGHNLEISDGKMSIYRYYSYPIKIDKLSFESAKVSFSALLEDSVKIRMRSDVPVGTTLSGGLDSTSIVAVLRNFYNGDHNTFTAHFPGFAKDELATANKTNKYYGLKGNTIVVDYNNQYIQTLTKIIYHLESGHLSPSVVPLWKVYEEAKNTVTVVLEGQGADELLGGYITSSAGFFLEQKLLNFKFRQFWFALIELKRNYSLTSILVSYIRLKFPSWVKTFLRKYILRYEKVMIGHLAEFKYNITPVCQSNSKFISHLQYLHQTTLSNLLHYGDAISMAFSIESRLPYLDYRLVNFAYALPEDYLISNGVGKFIQRESLKSIFPDFINKEVEKNGFGSPIAEFFNNNKEIIEQILFDKRSIDRGLFNEVELKKLMHSDLTSYKNSSRFIFRVLCVELWFKVFIDN